MQTLMQIRLIATSLLFGSLCLPAMAQMSGPVQLHAAAPGSDGGQTGVAVLSIPDYQGAKTSRTLLVPLIDYQWANGWFAGVSNGVGYNFGTSPQLDYGLRLTANLGRREKRSLRLRGMGDIKESAEIGSFFNWHFNSEIGISQTIQFGAGNTHRGASMNIAAHFNKTVGNHLRAGASLGAVYANEDSMRNFFGVDALQAARSHLPQFRARAGLQQTYVSAFVNYTLDERSALSLIVSSELLAGDAKSSPLTQIARTNTIVGAWTYHF
ncbi:MipA/OmpV family protein [Undibacterium fentianense]|uniref:MipA/OmpV family protein n=1 Tax=Undibacterium fentianense TaxID=2828728 RepID=A0A941IC32_9BURK|nr:MipA/OmpV family protein [Undibacterium fentianense]MBR7799759.1 MipA/OmpV family protein [Undibacterium fentianense]